MTPPIAMARGRGRRCVYGFGGWPILLCLGVLAYCLGEQTLGLVLVGFGLILAISRDIRW